MSFELNQKIREDYDACLDTILNGSEKVINFLNRVVSCQTQAAPQLKKEANNSPIIDVLETVAGKAIDTIAGPVAGSVIKTAMKEGKKIMTNFEAPKPPRRNFVDPLEQDMRLVDWPETVNVVKNTLHNVSEVRKSINESSELSDESKYKLELTLYNIQIELDSFLKRI